MIQFAGGWRVVAAGLAAGAVGVMVFAGAPASADPSVPTPTPAQNVVPVPGVTPNRFVATPPAPTPAATAPLPAGVTGTLRDYLQAKGVKLEPQKADGFRALDITLPMPTRWTRVPDPNVPDAFAVIADRLGASLYTSNAQLVVYRLVGNFDPKEAITHGFVDSQQLPAWQPTNASTADFCGFPSTVIEGTYHQNDMTLNTSRRNVIAASGADRYLLSLSVTTALAQAVADGPATDAIINGFRVSAPGSHVQAPTQTPATTQPGLPAQTAGTTQTVLPGQTPVPAQTPARAQTPVPVQAAVPAQTPVPVQAAVPAQTPVPVQAAVPAQTPVPAQTAGTAQVGLPAQVAAPAQTPGTQTPVPQQAPNYLALLPGLPPLPNFSALTGQH